MERRMRSGWRGWSAWERRWSAWAAGSSGGVDRLLGAAVEWTGCWEQLECMGCREQRWGHGLPAVAVAWMGVRLRVKLRVTQIEIRE